VKLVLSGLHVADVSCVEIVYDGDGPETSQVEPSRDKQVRGRGK
jgi:hypothetical protein